MRSRLSEALWHVFAMWTGTWSGGLAALYMVAWLATAPDGVPLVGFMSENGFASVYLAVFVIGLLYAAFFGAIVWWARGKSAKDYNLIERRIDAWLTRMSRNDRPR